MPTGLPSSIASSVPQELGVQRDHAIDVLGVLATRCLQALGVMEAVQRIDYRQTITTAATMVVEAGVACQRDRGVALVTWAHGRDHGLVGAARDAYHPDTVGPGFQLVGVRLQPACAVIDNGQRRRIAGDGPPCRSIISGNGPALFGLNRRSSSGLPLRLR